MTDNVIVVLAVVAGIVWLGLMVVAALRRPGREEVAPNLQPGTDDQQLETRRLERGQKFAIASSAFLAIALPLYFLSEPARQQAFVDEFEHASIERGEALVEEFACFDCHGPLGVGGTSSFVEPRSGVSVLWEAPPLDDIFFRHNEDEVNFWITFGRANTPMPAWGLPGGGPMNEEQVKDIVNYLQTIQISQEEAVARAAGAVSTQLSRLANADATMGEAILDQRQVLAEIRNAPEDVQVIEPLAARAREVLDGAGVGIDTDGDGLSDAAENELSAISSEAVAHFRVVEPIEFDPEVPDQETVAGALAQLEGAAPANPIMESYLIAIEAVLAEEDGEDEELSEDARQAISSLMAEASAVTIPSGITEVSLDPTNPESVAGQPDMVTATRLVAALESAALQLRVTTDARERLEAQEQRGLDFLLAAREARAWEFDFAGVAAAMGVSEEEAQRAVGLFNANCARCHTAGFSAGIPYTQEAGSGGFAPALWEGRPTVQFGVAPEDPEEDLLIEFLIRGTEAQTAYGLSGFGTGRMPGFGAVLSQDDIDLLARYLRGGSLSGRD